MTPKLKVTASSRGGEESVLEVDHIVLCAGQEPLAELMPDANAATPADAPRFHRVGGAARAVELDAKRAIREAAVLAAGL
ncbi:MAG: hypothetical protein Q8L93_06005 [Rhodocyclaceae bacterium]|nr:hypothetical protein [Rhodocyclaceae bacterium]MDP1957679.1 hypothetical protein [Rhodocyclaceae bacterium]